MLRMVTSSSELDCFTSLSCPTCPGILNTCPVVCCVDSPALHLSCQDILTYCVMLFPDKQLSMLCIWVVDNILNCLPPSPVSAAFPKLMAAKLQAGLWWQLTGFGFAYTGIYRSGACFSAPRLVCVTLSAQTALLQGCVARIIQHPVYYVADYFIIIKPCIMQVASLRIIITKSARRTPQKSPCT